MWAKPPVQWHPSEPTTEELARIERETGVNQFDKKGLKAGIWAAWKRGELDCTCKTSSVGRVIVFAPKGVAPDWTLWGKIFQWFGTKVWNVVWFAADAKRCFPTGELGPEHVNGGYTTPCSNDGIYIYRKEEATRVLIHELMHAACLDEPWTLPEKEAMVETWAELILVALKAKGDPKKGQKLWLKQSQWVANTNALAIQHGVVDSTDYAWRYLVGRAEMYTRLGMSLPAAGPHPSKSTRFTHPDLD